MANDINLTSAIRTNLASLQNTAQLLGKTQEKLATGLKVNNALDNPASFFTAKRLNDRASDLASRKDGIGQGIQTLKAADKTIQALDKLVANAKSLANRALDEDAETKYTQVVGSSFTASEATAAMTASASVVITLDMADGSTKTISLLVASSSTINDFVDQLDALDDVKAYINADRKVVIETGEEVSGFSIDTQAEWLGVDGSNSTATVTTDSDAVEARNKLSKEFDALLTQMKQLVDDSGYKGVNLLKKSDLTVKFNEDGSSKLDITGVNYDVTDTTSDIYIANAANKWKDDTDIDAALGDIEDAVSSMRAQASTFGSNLSVLEVRDKFTSDLISTLEEGASKLVQADMNAEAANLLALQTRQQLATTSLSMASQSEQGVLRLF